MEKKLMLPANYNVMNEEEMTYTEGGANLLQAVCAVAIPVYGWLAGVSAIRDYRKAHPTNWTSTGIDGLPLRLLWVGRSAQSFLLQT